MRCSVKKVFLAKSFTKFTRKHLCWSRLFSKAAGLKLTILLKKRLQHKSFPANFLKILRTPFFMEHLWWLVKSAHIMKYVFTHLLSFIESMP